jgi:hypothetical protein
VMERNRAPTDWTALGRLLTVADLMVLAVREQGRRPHADPPLIGATQIVALRGIQLARLTKLIANLVGTRAIAGGIATVLLQRWAEQIDTKRLLRVPIRHLLALLLRMLRPDAYAPLDLSSLRTQTLRRGAVTTLTLTSSIYATREVIKGHLAEVVVESVLSRNRSRCQGLGEPRSRCQKTACSRHPFITSCLHV